MLVVSKFHDYYDPVARSKGVDKTIVYKRETVEKEDEKTCKIVKSFLLPSFQRTERIHGVISKESSYNMVIIGFCGKFYPMFICYQRSTDYTTSAKTNYLYDQGFISVILESFNSPKVGRYRHYRPLDKFRDYQEVLKSDTLSNLYTDQKCPVVQFGVVSGICTTPNLILNPPLKPLNFMTVVEPFTAFQELEMYISGVLGSPEKPMIQISEKDKLISHGMDPKYGFRKMPTKRKR